MFGSELSCFSFWWIIPIIMMIMCFIMMRNRRGAMMCGFGSRDDGNYKYKGSDTAEEILDKRYASGEISKDEYKEMNKALTDSTDDITD